MRFDFEAYEKVFPTVTEAPKPIDTITETFHPTSDEMAKDDKPGEVKMEVIEAIKPTTPSVLEETLGVSAPEGENNNE